MLIHVREQFAWPRGITPVERIMLSAHGDLQRLLRCLSLSVFLILPSLTIYPKRVLCSSNLHQPRIRADPTVVTRRSAQPFTTITICTKTPGQPHVCRACCLYRNELSRHLVAGIRKAFPARWICHRADIQEDWRRAGI